MTAILQSDSLELRLSNERQIVDAAQSLRYRVFVEEMGAVVSPLCHLLRRDIDRFDDVRDHLVVLDRAASSPNRPVAVGAYRLLRRSVAARTDGFYSAGEFDLRTLLATRGELLELGRSCVAPEHRSGHVVQLLWRGLGDYIEQHDVDVMFGCASLPGIQPEAVAHVLSWLHRDHLAPASFRPAALADRHVAMDILPPYEIDESAARRQLPPLLKGYLCAGALVGDGASLDLAFRCIDVCVLLPAERIRQRHRARFQRPVRQPVRVAA